MSSRLLIGKISNKNINILWTKCEHDTIFGCMFLEVYHYHLEVQVKIMLPEERVKLLKLGLWLLKKLQMIPQT